MRSGIAAESASYSRIGSGIATESASHNRIRSGIAAESASYGRIRTRMAAELAPGSKIVENALKIKRKCGVTQFGQGDFWRWPGGGPAECARPSKGLSAFTALICFNLP